MSGLFLFLVMQSFLEAVVNNIVEKQDSYENLVFVLPSKRAGTFLRRAIAKAANKTFFSPEIFSIESFVEEISGLAYATGTQQLFTLYHVYLAQETRGKDDFFTFSKWAQTLLQDFNEIDRYLVDATELFSNLAAIQEINHWSLQKGKTKMMEDYLRFWNDLEPLYHSFTNSLLGQGLGHQGLVYRKACQRLEGYMELNSEKTVIFIGFNALNTAESQIFQRILSTLQSEIYWDIDSYFLDDAVHDAGYFIRRHLENWTYFEQNEMKGVSSDYLSKKHIEIIGMPKNVSQAKYTGQLLSKINEEHPDQLKRTAVVLGDETLLNPILNAVPQEISAVNITMGYPLRKSPMASLFDQFIELYINWNDEGWVYHSLQTFLTHPYIHILLGDADDDKVTGVLKTIKKKNWAYIDAEKLLGIIGRGVPSSLLFLKEVPSTQKFIETCLHIIAELKLKLQKREDALSLEYLYRFFTLFNQLFDLVQKYTFVTDLKSLQGIYRELLSSETLDFQGEPLEGLQIMGMLESRNLDFETVIITSVNEGILPSGKSNNSFIPFDLKANFGLPTYKEKDAVYTYHFYRLLQRAKHIYILYNTEPDVLEGGERSRLISQLLTDSNVLPNIREIIASPKITPVLKTLESIGKNKQLLSLIKGHASSGFSPTSLSNYIRNPIDFYKRNLLRIDDVLEVEETIASNTFGTIVHDTLEDFYKPFLGEYLSEEKLFTAKSKIKDLVKHHFSKSYLEGDISRGKNLIAFNVVVRYVENFIDMEIENLKQHQIKIIGLEEKLNVSLDFPEIDYPILLKGKLDRIDEIDGTLRIIDYKTGKVTTSQVEIVDWNDITREFDYSKAFQLLTYAILYNAKNPIEAIEAGIFSFKNLNAGLLRFATKEKKGSRKKDHCITQETLFQFNAQLKKLILEICNPNIPFTEKEV